MLRLRILILFGPSVEDCCLQHWNRFLWFPLSFAAVERSFSLVGLIDAPNRQRMGERVREACVTMFFNGDVEQRFTKD